VRECKSSQSLDITLRLGKSNGVPGTICLALILCLLLFSTRGAVWRQAIRYAKHLAEALEMIEATKAESPKTRKFRISAEGK